MQSSRYVSLPDRTFAALAGALLGFVALLPAGSSRALVSSSLGSDRGCNFTRIVPEWVSVEAADAPVIVEGVVRASHVARSDNPLAHLSHDWNFDVALDPAYDGFNSDANPIEDGERRMEMEWETRYFPPSFWPIKGDRVWMMGRWIFDCGHPPYRTEIHPPIAVAFTRLEPTILPGDAAPSLTNKTFIYIHGKGGYHDAPVAVRDYAFDIRLPPKPSPTAAIRTGVLSLPFGGPAPVLSPDPAANVVHVVYPLGSVNDPSPSRKFAAVVLAGWREPVITKGYRQLRVTFDSVKIRHDHDPFFSGEWRLFARTGGQWFEIPGLGDVDDGDTVSIGRSTLLTVPDDGSVTIQTTGWEDDCDGAFGGGSIDPCLANDNDAIGIIDKSYTASSGFGIGSHDDGARQNGDDDTSADHQLRYRIEQTARFAPGTPQTSGGPDTKNVTVTFLAAKVLDDTDPIGSGDIWFDFDVNDQRLRFPATGTRSIGSGQSVSLGDLGVTLALHNNDTLRIQVAGTDDDPLFNPDDPLGVVNRFYVWNENFGAGTHTERSTKPDGQFDVTYRIDSRDVLVPPVLDPVVLPMPIARLFLALDIEPASGKVPAGEALQFAAVPPDVPVTWSVEGAGTISPEGIYQAPATVGEKQAATVRAAATDGSERAATAVVTLLPERMRRKSDVNGDGRINVLDATLALRMVVLTETADPAALEAADTNGDGRVTVGDVTTLLRTAVGLPVSMTFPEEFLEG